jgi:glycosyltransferase involved in cell wall biosynthesis
LKYRQFCVVFLNAKLFPIGGTAIRTLNFARAIKNHVDGVNVITWQPTDTDEFRDAGKVSSIVREGISVDTMPLGHQFLRKYLRFLYVLALVIEYSDFSRKAVQGKKVVDVIHCANETIWIGVLLKWILKKPIIADIHANPLDVEIIPNVAKAFQQSVFKFLLRIADKSIDGYLVPTEELKDLLISFGLPSKKLKVVPNAVYLHEKDTSKSRATIRTELGLDEDTIVIAFHGMLMERYNVDALSKLSEISKIIGKELDRKIKFIIIGFYEKVPVHNENFIYTGYVEDLNEYLRAADLAVVPIFENSFGIRSRLLDYFMTSLPVLTTPVGVTGMRFVQDSAAVIVRSSVEELAQSVIELVNSPGKLKEMAYQSKKLTEWFSPEKIAKELLSFYLQTVTQKNSQDHW